MSSRQPSVSLKVYSGVWEGISVGKLGPLNGKAAGMDSGCLMRGKESPQVHKGTCKRSTKSWVFHCSSRTALGPLFVLTHHEPTCSPHRSIHFLIGSSTALNICFGRVRDKFSECIHRLRYGGFLRGPGLVGALPSSLRSTAAWGLLHSACSERPGLKPGGLAGSGASSK